MEMVEDNNGILNLINEGEETFVLSFVIIVLFSLSTAVAQFLCH